MSTTTPNPAEPSDHLDIPHSAVVAQEKWPAFEDEEGHIRVIDGKTLSKNVGWWSAVLLVDTYGKVQVKLYLWQQRLDKTSGVPTWKRKQSWTVNSFNWAETAKIINEFLEKRKLAKPTTAAYQPKA
jgi:hypothetical protein